MRYAASRWLGYIFVSLVAGLAMAAVGSAIAISMFEPKYEAKLFFRIIQDRDWHLLSGGKGEQQDFQSVASCINSEIIASRVAVDEGVATLAEIRSSDDPVNQLRSMVDVRPQGGERSAIRVVSTVPENAAVIAQAYWDHYNEAMNQYKASKSKAMYEVLAGESSMNRDRLNCLDADLQEMSKQVAGPDSVLDLENEVEFASTLLREHKSQLEVKKIEIMKTQMDIVRFEEDPDDKGVQLQDLKHRLKKLEIDMGAIKDRIAEQKEIIRSYQRLKFDYERKKEEFESERKRLLALEERERDLRMRQIAPFNVQREGIVSVDEPVPVPTGPVEKYPRKQLIAITGLSLAAAFLLVGLVRIFNLHIPGLQDSATEDDQQPRLNR